MCFRCITAFCLVGISVSPFAFAQSTAKGLAASEKIDRIGHASVVGNHTVFAEAEDFTVESKGWEKKPFGTNYYAATFANCFLSRKSYLGAPEQTARTVATLEVNFPKAGKYLALIRYEAAYRFETEFRFQVEQKGTKKLDRLYGSRNNLRVWAFNERLKKEVAWSWGAGENVVWEGHDAFVDLEAGPATLRLIADNQPEPAARRNIDLVMLTTDMEEVDKRIKKEAYLPLDGLLTQAGDVYVKVGYSGFADVKLTIPNGTEHSPYWVHMRSWKPLNMEVKLASKPTEWIEVGHLLDSLSDGQWTIKSTGKGAYTLEFGVKEADGKILPIRKFDNLVGDTTFAYDADTRNTKRIRLQEEVLYELVDYLKKNPVAGVAPKRTLIYGYTFPANKENAKYTKALEEFLKLTGATALGRDQVEEVNDSGLVKGYIDVRSVPTNKLEDYCKKLQADGKADKIASVSLGDEIGLATPAANDHAGFRRWCQSKGLKPADVDPAADSWEKVQFTLAPKVQETNPRLFYYSKIYSYRYGIGQLKERTDILKRYLPNAGIGANFSPHHKHMYLGETHHWISLFREGGMTMPWGEDYIWQVPVASSQVNDIMVDMFRCAIRDQPKGKIQYYVMPHSPNNTPDMWRRLFFSTIGHGAKILNLFEYRPVQFAYTENHTSDPRMFQEVRKSIHELGNFDDIVQDGRVRSAKAAIWLSETADVWDDHKAPMDANLRCLYLMARQQGPLDFVIDGDDLRDYRLLYLCDAHVSQAGSKRIAEWVKSGGKVFATAGAGMFDEFNQPNQVLRELFKFDFEKWVEAPGPTIVFEKQDLPFAEPVGTSTPQAGASKSVAYGKRSLGKTLPGGNELAKFDDGSSAGVLSHQGKGTTFYVSELPGLAAFRNAFPKRPMDRGATSESMTHFLPTKLDSMWTNTLLHIQPKDRKVGLGTTAVNPSVDQELSLDFDPVHPFGPTFSKNARSARAVASTAIDSPHGTAVVLVNWSYEKVKDFRFGILGKHDPAKVTLASGRPVRVEAGTTGVICTLDLEDADAIILRNAKEK